MINIRKLEKKDNKYFNQLINDNTSHYKEFLSNGWPLREINNQFNKSTNLSYGVFYNDLLISFIFGDLINIEKISEYEILLIYVSKYFRKKGLGTKLLKEIKENNNLLKKIYLEVSKNNLEGISFYNKMGFKHIYTRKDYLLIENKKVDALVMLKNY
ncbi:GNAT family N-acetyltransferase [Pelagibacteraceae bacterium]|nr:GNAT family N-acetyltransferase [Pelagibacteraceae bacterium]